MQVIGNGMTGGLAWTRSAWCETDFGLVIGAHFESGTPTADHLDFSIRLTGDVDFQSIFGAVPIAWYAMAARRYM